MDYTPPAIERCAPTVAPSTMQRIIRVESAGRTHVIGYHITKNGKPFRLTTQPKTQDEAVKWVRWLLDNGYRFDAGPSQVNSQNFARLGLTAENVFDPCANIGAGGKILTEFYRKAVKQYGEGQGALRAAISAYQTGSFTRGWGTGYVQKVTGAAVVPRWIAGNAPVSVPASEGAVIQSKPVYIPQNAPTAVKFYSAEE